MVQNIFNMNKSEFVSNICYSCRILFIILIITVGVLYMMEWKFLVNFNLSSTDQSVAIDPHELSKHCIVYTQERCGRLGNRIFIVASAYGLARLHSCYLYVSPEIIRELKETFKINISSLTLSSMNSLKSMNRTSRDVGCQYLPELTRPNAIPPGTIFELKGYWQSYLHFEKYNDELREHIFVAKREVLMKISRVFVNIYQERFGVKPSFSSDDHQLLKKQIAQSNLTTWIGMHVRRSDFASLNYSSSDEYLFSAIQYYTSPYSNAHFLVATDDKPYCKNLFRSYSNIFLTPQSFSPGEDLIALSVCQHSIVTGGTFSWWAAYLTNGQVVHDKVYPSGCERREQYYPPWYMIDENVRAGNNIE